MQFCSKCGQQVTPGSGFCANCGSPVAVPPQAQAQPAQPVPAPPRQQQPAVIYVQGPAQPQPKSSGVKVLLWLGVGAAVIVVLIIVAVLFFRVGQRVQTYVDNDVAQVPSNPSPGQDSSSDSGTPDQPTVSVAALQSVLKQDADLRNSLKEAVNNVNIQSSDDFDKIASAMRDYVADARQIDTTDCPRDFAEAFSLHLSAWKQLADSVAGHPDVPQGDDAFIYGFLRGEQGDPTGGAVELQDEVKNWLKDLQDKESLVDRAEGDLDAIAVKYGAK
jgi:hypothetical protein